MGLKTFFGQLSVDSIVADIQKKVEQLHIVKEAVLEEQKLHEMAIAERTRLREAAQAEWARALRLADKFKELIS